MNLSPVLISCVRQRWTDLIDPKAIIDERAQVADDVCIGPYTVIGPDVTIGSGT
ncbi:MAG: hypothetical protein Q7U30_08715, partial [Methylicorpusculum sp.]|nr:hypothetical protein [Methylicorpusculum sp.]